MEDGYTKVQWKTQEYKAEVTSTGSYAMFSKTGNHDYLNQSGEWKIVKNMAQDYKRYTRVEFEKYRDKLYKRPYNLPIDMDAHNFAKYTVLRSWINRESRRLPIITKEEKSKKIGEFAHILWTKRGSVIGSPEMDWKNAEKVYEIIHKRPLVNSLMELQVICGDNLDIILTEMNTMSCNLFKN
jgi:hypothetical protein